MPRIAFNFKNFPKKMSHYNNSNYKSTKATAFKNGPLNSFALARSSRSCRHFLFCPISQLLDTAYTAQLLDKGAT